jgi:uncharacterized protein YqeY
MSLQDQVTKAIADAMRAKDHIRLDALRMLKAALVNREIEKAHPLDEAESLQVVASLIKQRRESIEQFTAGGRQELADKEAAEIRVLQAYLPAAADEHEVQRVVDEAIAEAGASSPRDLGRVMKLVMPRLAGKQVDGKLVNELVRRKLGA